MNVLESPSRVNRFPTCFPTTRMVLTMDCEQPLIVSHFGFMFWDTCTLFVNTE